jgi:NADH-quinone oxidoreductase subunit N
MLNHVAELQANLTRDLLTLAPEMVLCSSILVILFLRLFDRFQKTQVPLVALGASILAATLTIFLSINLAGDGQNSLQQKLFGGLLQRDLYADIGRLLLQVFLGLLLILNLLTKVPDSTDAADYVTLLLGATVGLSLMTMSQHLIMIFIAIEMASLPSYALAGFLKQRRTGGEAALKYVIYGAAASGTMLFGISLLTIATGTGYLPAVHQMFSSANLEPNRYLVAEAGLALTLIGFGFKLAAAPFHVWMPDVLEGALVEVGAFLSVASKAGAILLAGRFLAPLLTHVDWLPTTLLIVSMLTATVGNVLALAQTNLKRIFAYSSIAHAGYMMSALAVPDASGVSAIQFYLMGYAVTNLAAFSCLAFLRNRTGAETLTDLSGLSKQSPILATVFTISLMSLLGLPPLAGFTGKFAVFTSLFSARAIHPLFLVTLIVLGINTVISAAFYLRILKVMTLDEATSTEKQSEPKAQSAFLSLLAIGIVLLGILWGPLIDFTTRAIQEW